MTVGATLSLASSVSSNTADDGGGLYCNGGALGIGDSTIRNNLGGGVFSSGDFTMLRCSVSGNTAEQGGGLRLLGTDRQLVVRNSEILSNTSTVAPSLAGGGGLFASLDAGSTLTVESTLIAANLAAALAEEQKRIETTRKMHATSSAHRSGEPLHEHRVSGG